MRAPARAPSPEPSHWFHTQVKVKKERLTGKAAAGSIAATAGMGKGTQLAFESQGLRELARREKGGIFCQNRGQLGGAQKKPHREAHGS